MATRYTQRSNSERREATVMSEKEHPICSHVDEYVKTLNWSSSATEDIKTLVIGNLRGFAAHLAAGEISLAYAVERYFKIDPAEQVAEWCEAGADLRRRARLLLARDSNAPRATAEADRWDKSGLKEACQRGIAIGRTRQEFDLQLLLDMLLEIERLETAPRATGETTVEAWLPIETAPKDGTEVLLGHGNSVWIDQWIEFEDGAACWMMCDQWSEPEVPSHWQHMPDPPHTAQVRAATQTGENNA